MDTATDIRIVDSSIRTMDQGVVHTASRLGRTAGLQDYEIDCTEGQAYVLAVDVLSANKGAEHRCRECGGHFLLPR